MSLVSYSYGILSHRQPRFWVGPSPKRRSAAPAHRLANRVRTPLRDGRPEPLQSGKPARNPLQVLHPGWCCISARARGRHPIGGDRIPGNTTSALGPHCETCAAALALSHANHLPSVRKSDRRRPRDVAVSPVLFTHLQVGRSAQLDERGLSHPASHHRRRPRSRDLDVELNAPPGHPRVPQRCPAPCPSPAPVPGARSSSVCVMIESSEP